MTRAQKNLKLNAKSFIGAKFGVDSFAAYAYSRRVCPLEFFIVFKLKNNKNFQWTNALTAVRVCCK